MDFEKYLKEKASEIGINIDDIKCSQFKRYKEMLISTNKVMNLTALTDDKDVAIKHFLDSISPILSYDFSGKKAIDVGTGAGFPSVPIKIMCPEMNLTLLDSLAKRIDFLKGVCSENNLENIEFVHSRAEDAGQDIKYREKFDVCFSRAVANLSVLCEYCLPFLKRGGMFVSLKGPMVFDEIKEAENALKILGGTIEKTEKILLPDTDVIHYIVFIKKESETPSMYPRKSNKISKKPL